MPPKAPTLKFKPKLVIRQAATTTTSNTSDSNNNNANPASPSSIVDDFDDLSLVQLDRLRRQQEEASGRATPSSQQQQQQAASATSKPASPHSTTGTMSPRGRGGASGSGGSGVGSFAARQRGIESYVDASRYPVTAAPLPVNTINRIVLAGSDEADMSGMANNEEDGVQSKAGMQLGPHTNVYAPIPLDPSLPAHMRQQRNHTSLEDKANNNEEEAISAVAQQDKRPLDGTAFLREYDVETAQMYEANMHFYRDILAPVSETATLTGDDTTITTEQATSSSSSASLPLVWLQLPRAFGEGTPNLHALPPGKVGELKVMRSGRMVLEIAGVEYEVAVEETTHHKEESGKDDKTGERLQDGACTMAVATMPQSNALDPDAQPSCFQLGMITRKLICTPALDKMLPQCTRGGDSSRDE